MKRLIDVLVNPNILLDLSLLNLSSILSEARYFNMLPQVKYLCESHQINHLLPSKFKQHLESANLYYENQCVKLKHERDEIKKVISELNTPWIYLKGSAYHLKNIKGFTGRMMSDIDILVHEKNLRQIETTLKSHGWMSKKINNYDEKFYRNWSQEIPPLKHVLRQVDIDIHFNILPKTIKESLDGEHLFEQAIAIDDNHNEKILKPHAMLVHSAIHLFYESEYHKGLRDLYDIAIFVKEYGNEMAFWEKVIELQDKIGNQQSMYFALRYCQKVYQVQIPKTVTKHYQNFKPNLLALKLLDFCFLNVFTSMYPPHKKLGLKFSCAVLYLRGHLKRMPINLLIPHLTKKSLDKFTKKEESHALV